MLELNFWGCYGLLMLGVLASSYLLAMGIDWLVIKFKKGGKAKC